MEDSQTEERGEKKVMPRRKVGSYFKVTFFEEVVGAWQEDYFTCAKQVIQD